MAAAHQYDWGAAELRRECLGECCCERSSEFGDESLSFEIGNGDGVGFRRGQSHIDARIEGVRGFCVLMGVE